ncbi:CHAT domain-containing protein [Streptomyces sp. NPDC056716]|uniref:CHAT domain-containing protein n=1 Tax=unclassified Streptomyces TaxID=2593676 RepID=UPI0036A51F65
MSWSTHAMRRYERGSALFARYQADGDPALLDESIDVFRQAREKVRSADEGHLDILAGLGFAFMTRYADRPPAEGRTDDIDNAIECYTALLVANPGIARRYTTLLWLGDAHSGRFEQGGRHASDAEAAVHALRQCLEMLLSPEMRGLLAEPERVRLPEVLASLGSAVTRLLDSHGDERNLPTALAATQQVLEKLPGPGQAATHCAQIFAQLVHLVRERTDLDVDVAVVRESLDRLAPRASGYEVAWQAVEQYRRTGDPGPLDVAVEALREITQDTEASGEVDVGHFGALGYALLQRALSAPSSPDVDEGIAAFRVAYRHADTESSRDVCVQGLCELLVLRYRVSGHLSDLDEVIALHMGTVDRYQDNLEDAPGFAAAATALQRRAEAVGDHQANTMALAMRMLHNRGEKAGMLRSFFNLPYSQLAELADESVLTDSTFLDEVDAVIERSRLRLEGSTGEERTAALHDLVDALHARARASGGAFADEHIDRLRELTTGLRDLHRGAHEAELGFALHDRFRRHGDTCDLDEALSCLGRAAAVDTVPTLFRLVAAKARGHFAAQAERWEVADDAYGLAIGLLPRLTARHLSHDDHLRQLSQLAGLATDAAAAAIRNGDPARALELLEQGRGLLIGYVLDAQHDLGRLTEAEPALAEALRDAGDRLAEEVDPHAPVLPGIPSVADRRIGLAREWDRAIAAIRVVPGFADFLAPPSLSDLVAAAAGGPVITVNVSRFGCDALVLTEGGVTEVPLPDLSDAEVRQRAAGFLATLPFAELSPDDEEATADAQEPLRQTLSWLWDAVVGPVFERLEAYERVWWIPTGLLAALPLHAAAVDKAVSSYAPTIRALRAAQTHRPPDAALTGQVVTIADAPGLPPLPGAAAEAARLADRFPTFGHLSGTAASRDGVLAAFRDVDWAHIACHASSYPAWPVDSALHLFDGPLTAGEVLAARSGQGHLAYLSACETVLADSVLADEVIHLGSAFHTAGFRHVIGTLWRVTDGTATETARLFYDNLPPNLDADQAAQALHTTAVGLRTRYPKFPTRWASYVHIGP